MNADASTITLFYTILMGTIIPIVVLWLQQISWPSYYKFALAACLSIIAASLEAYSSGKLTPAETAQNFMTIFTIAQTVYFTFFRTLNLHAFFYPQDALANQTKDQIAESISNSISPELAKNILDVNSPKDLSVQLNVTEIKG